MRRDDIVDDHDLESAVRALLAPMPRSPAWERSQRERLLAAIESGASATESMTADRRARLTDLEHGVRSTMVSSRRRLVVLGGTAAAVVLLVVGLATTQRPEEPLPAQAPATEPGDATTVPDATVAVPSTNTAFRSTGFTPLVVGTPPTGYVLRGVETGAGGVLTYGTDANSTELWLVARDSTSDPDHFDDQMRDLGRRSWEIDGRTVWSDGELDGCLPDVCSVGAQWDERTVVRLMWVEPEGGTIAPGADQESLLALLPTLTVDASIWAGSDASLDVGDGAGMLLVPAVGVEVELANAVMSGPPGGMSAVVRTSNGAILNLHLSRNPEPLDDVPAAVGSRSFGELAVTGSFDAQIDVYDVSNACWSLRIDDGGGTGIVEPWRSEITQLLESLQVSGTSLELPLPTGWDLLSLTEPAPLYEMVLTVEAQPTPVSILQSPARAAAYAATLAAHDVEQVSFLGGEAWAGTIDFDPPATAVYWFHNGTFATATATGISVQQIEEIVATMRPVTPAVWEDRFGTVDDLDAGDGSCPPVALVVAAT